MISPDWSTNGIGWYGVDMQTGAEGDHALPFPTPEALWLRCFPQGNDWRDRFGAVPFETGGGKWQPRYYQHNAITAALEAARIRLADAPSVTLRLGAVPSDWPSGVFDTIVFSEVGYYLSRDDLQATIGLIGDSLAADGCVLACHWRHPVAEYPLSGDEVHIALRSVAAWERLILHEEEDFLLEVFCRRPAVSVAHREGLR